MLLFANLIAGNTSIDGGGLSVFDDYHQGVNQIIDNVIVRNRATDAGGGIFLVDPAGHGSMVLVNNTVADNDSAGGSAILVNLADSQTSLINNLIIAKTDQVAMSCGTLTLKASPNMNSNDVFASGAALFVGTCKDQTGSSGNISANPQFKSAQTGDYHLQAGSPAIDAGNNAFAPATDFDGELRPLDGNGDGRSVVDIGAFEFVPQ